MELIADAHIFGHSRGFPVTCKVQHRFKSDPAQGLRPISTWKIFDVSHPLPDGTYTIDAGAGGRLMHCLNGQWAPARYSPR